MSPSSALQAILTAPEAARRYRRSHRYIVALASSGKVKARRSNGTWLIDEISLRKYLSTKHKPGPKRRKKPSK